jgi:hypothetical protein
LTQLTIACTGRPKLLLRKAVDPRNGFIAVERFPTIAALNKWFKDQEPDMAPEYKLLPPVREEPLTPEQLAERVKQADMAKAVAEEIRKATGRVCVGRPAGWQRQVHKPDELLEGLESLEAMKARPMHG